MRRDPRMNLVPVLCVKSGPGLWERKSWKRRSCVPARGLVKIFHLCLRPSSNKSGQDTILPSRSSLHYFMTNLNKEWLAYTGVAQHLSLDCSVHRYDPFSLFPQCAMRPQGYQSYLYLKKDNVLYHVRMILLFYGIQVLYERRMTAEEEHDLVRSQVWITIVAGLRGLQEGWAKWIWVSSSEWPDWLSSLSVILARGNCHAHGISWH